MTLLWGLRLPITVVSETVTSCGGTPVRRPVQEARDEGEALLRDRLTRLLADTGTAERIMARLLIFPTPFVRRLLRTWQGSWHSVFC